MAEAVGILEVFGLATAFVAADAGCKAANVHLEVFDKNKPANADSLPVPLLVCIKYRGSVSDVTAAVEAGMKVAESMTGVVQHYIIPNPEPGTQKMLKISALDTDYEDSGCSLYKSAGIIYDKKVTNVRFRRIESWHRKH